MADLTNDFGWSSSRASMFEECRRRYFLTYYRAWGGWEQNAPKPVRDAYVLKKLDNRWSWAGHVIHDIIRRALLMYRNGRQVDVAKMIDGAHLLMREDWRFSAERQFWTARGRKGFTGLVEHEYREDVAAAAWKALWLQIQASLRWWFLESRWPVLARELEPKQWLTVDEKDFEKTVILVDGVRVFAVPDFAYIEGDETVTVVDWKTGRAPGTSDQLVVYALFIEDKFGIPAESVRGRFVYLQDGTERPVRIGPTDLQALKERMFKSVCDMRELLVDVERNVPRDENAFPKTSDLKTCARCSFRRLCGREAAQTGRAA